MSRLETLLRNTKIIQPYNCIYKIFDVQPSLTIHIAICNSHLTENDREEEKQ